MDYWPVLFQELLQWIFIAFFDPYKANVSFPNPPKKSENQRLLKGVEIDNLPDIV